MEDESLNTLLRQPKQLEIGGKTYVLRPFDVRAVPVMTRLVRDVWIELLERPDLLRNQAALLGWLMMQLPDLIETKIEDLIKLMNLQTDVPIADLERIPLDDFMVLGKACLEDGLDFFIRKILPNLPGMSNPVGSGTGLMSSLVSSLQATAETTSRTTA